ncbi:hypothetical protein PRUPE_8G152800 [Prunus persica]|uniref:Uncharacterized protein n=1 Tax=Prunus persica TaxID=3760 RepID=M5W4X8_PRUPE|nr:hypothetical protein PRUPE_8G152800 [Prunus persica]
MDPIVKWRRTIKELRCYYSFNILVVSHGLHLNFKPSLKCIYMLYKNRKHNDYLISTNEIKSISSYPFPLGNEETDENEAGKCMFSIESCKW